MRKKTKERLEALESRLEKLEIGQDYSYYSGSIVGWSPFRTLLLKEVVVKLVDHLDLELEYDNGTPAVHKLKKRKRVK